MLFYEFTCANGRHVRLPATAALVTKVDAVLAGEPALYKVCVIGGPSPVAYETKAAPRLVEHSGSGEAPIGAHPMLLVDSAGVRPAPDAGCLTRADGECVSRGPCMHTPLDENDCPLPTCSECGAYHEVVRPGKTQPTCVCDAYRAECGKTEELRRQLDDVAKLVDVVRAYRLKGNYSVTFAMDEHKHLHLVESDGFAADLSDDDKRFLVDLGNAALGNAKG